MRLPDGRDCPYYAVNYHRRVTPQETCHLLAGSPDAARWSSDLCATCPVPDIRRANGCPNMVLHLRIGKRPWRIWESERVLVRATCRRTKKPVKNPYTGCGQCHAPITFVVAEDAENAEPE